MDNSPFMDYVLIETCIHGEFSIATFASLREYIP